MTTDTEIIDYLCDYAKHIILETEQGIEIIQIEGEDECARDILISKMGAKNGK